MVDYKLQFVAKFTVPCLNLEYLLLLNYFYFPSNPTPEFQLSMLLRYPWQNLTSSSD